MARLKTFLMITYVTATKVPDEPPCNVTRRKNTDRILRITLGEIVSWNRNYFPEHDRTIVPVTLQTALLKKKEESNISTQFQITDRNTALI